MNEWIQFTQGVGFPAAVAIFVLWRIDASIRDLTRAVNTLIILLRVQGVPGELPGGGYPGSGPR